MEVYHKFGDAEEGLQLLRSIGIGSISLPFYDSLVPSPAPGGYPNDRATGRPLSIGIMTHDGTVVICNEKTPAAARLHQRMGQALGKN